MSKFILALPYSYLLSSLAFFQIKASFLENSCFNVQFFEISGAYVSSEKNSFYSNSNKSQKKIGRVSNFEVSRSAEIEEDQIVFSTSSTISNCNRIYIGNDLSSSEHRT